jgi:S-(hydroxymethyl)glutathione dehydrogenase/alcohol dehydrogenase
MRNPGEPLTIELVDSRPLADSAVRVSVDASGVCHSDLTILRNGMGGLAPVILGHEACGTVLEVGSLVRHVKPDDRVIGSFVPVCGSCWNCVNARTQFCTQLIPIALKAHWTNQEREPVWSMSGLGTFSEEMVVDQSSVVVVESDLPAEQLALLGCSVMTGIGAVLNTAAVPPGSTVAVIGCGGVGQFVVQGAKIAGAVRVIAIDPIQAKREAALLNGATDLIDPTKGSAVEEVMALTGGRGVDFAFEVVGMPHLIHAAFQMCRVGGSTVAVGMPTDGATLTLNAAEIFSTEKRIIGSFYGSGQVRRDFHRLIAYVESGALDLQRAVSRTIQLDEVNAALDSLESGDDIRTVIVPK